MRALRLVLKHVVLDSRWGCISFYRGSGLPSRLWVRPSWLVFQELPGPKSQEVGQEGPPGIEGSGPNKAATSNALSTAPKPPLVGRPGMTGTARGERTYPNHSNWPGQCKGDAGQTKRGLSNTLWILPALVAWIGPARGTPHTEIWRALSV